MPTRSGIVTQAEQDRANGDGPQAAYWMSDGGGGYILGAGKKALEAAAFWKDDGGGGYVLDDDSAEEDRPMYLLGTDEVIV